MATFWKTTRISTTKCARSRFYDGIINSSRESGLWKIIKSNWATWGPFWWFGESWNSLSRITILCWTFGKHLCTRSFCARWSSRNRSRYCMGRHLHELEGALHQVPNRRRPLETIPRRRRTYSWMVRYTNGKC